MKKIFSTAERSQIAEAIANAECFTSSEIRVHIDRDCPEDPVDKAVQVFNQLEMFNTKNRNAVLIFLSIKDKKFAIIGDQGIDAIVGYNFWDNVYITVVPFLKNGKYAEGLILAVKMAGDQLGKYFPVENDDINELSNEISFGE